MDPKIVLSTARLIARSRAPYFSSALLNLLPEEAPGLGTIGVSHRYVLLWDPIWMRDQQPEEIATLLLHEIMHPLRDHHRRIDSLTGLTGGADITLDRIVKNVAADMEINDDEFFMQMPRPKSHWVTPKDFDFKNGLLLEEYHQLLKEGKDTASKLQQKGINKPGAGFGWCGSAAGNPVPGEGDDGNGPTFDGRSDVEMSRITRTVASEIQAEAVRQNGRGRFPGSWKRWADSIIAPPKIPWRSKLARAVRGDIADQIGAVDHRYSLPSRRQAGIGFGPGRPILPCLRAPRPRVAVFADTSGSMAKGELTIAAREVRGILIATGAEINYCACDAAVQVMQIVKDWRCLASLLKGGGGTDFRPAFKALTASRKMHPSIIIALTDGCGPAPAEPPKDCKVIWLLIGPYRQHPHFPNVEWGEFIEMED